MNRAMEKLWSVLSLVALFALPSEINASGGQVEVTSMTIKFQNLTVNDGKIMILVKDEKEEDKKAGDDEAPESEEGLTPNHIDMVM